MGYKLSGTYLADCSCALFCPCSVDGTPTGPENKCWGGAVFHVDRGKLDDVDLAGVNFGMLFHFPQHFTAGNWKMGVVIDDGASDAQAQAIGQILSGQAGGPFAEFAPLISELVGPDRGAVTFSDGDKPSASIAGFGELTFDGLTGPDGGPTVVTNAMFAFAPTYKVGKSGGKADVFGRSTDLQYAESADFEYSSEATDIHPRA